MSDDRGEIRHINWGELFSFTHIFKSFKLAIHPSKMILAVAAIVLVWAAGGALDYVWCWTGTTARPGEAQKYAAEPDSFKPWIEQWDGDRLSKARGKLQDVQGRGSNFDDIMLRPGLSTSTSFLTAFNASIQSHLSELPQADKQAPEKLRDFVKKIQRGQNAQADVILSVIEEARKNRKAVIAKLTDKDREDAQKQLTSDYIAARTNLANWKRDNNATLAQIEGVGVFDTFTSYEWNCISNAIAAVGNGNILGGWLDYQEPPAPENVDSYTGTVVPRTGAQAVPTTATPGFVFYAIRAIGGLKWLLTQHTLFAAILLVIALAVWALFGGAIHRVAALHAAREEKISIVQALKFAMSKWPSFFTAPLIPLAVVFVLGAMLVIGGLLTNIPYAGAPLTGILFFLAVGLGFAVAFILVGLFSGMGLMYPTIAVEGSDSFDAFSRSFAYVYARPWHAGLYAFVTLVYGVACYLFVRFFAFLALSAAHMFMRWGSFSGGESLGQSDMIPVIWRQPTWDSLYGNFHWEAMSGSETVGAVFIWLWVALVGAMVGGFILSFASSSSTIVYYLLRRKVDATDLDDVYVQGSPESDVPVETPAATAAATEAPPAGDTSSASDAPPANP